jgi:hypothetical protein
VTWFKGEAAPTSGRKTVRLYVVWDMPGRDGFHGLVWVLEPNAARRFYSLMLGGTFAGSNTHLKRVLDGEDAAVSVYRAGGSRAAFMQEHGLPYVPMRWVV